MDCSTILPCPALAYPKLHCEVSGVSWPAGDRDRAQSRASNTEFFCHPSLPYLPHPTLDFTAILPHPTSSSLSLSSELPLVSSPPLAHASLADAPRPSSSAPPHIVQKLVNKHPSHLVTSVLVWFVYVRCARSSA